MASLVRSMALTLLPLLALLARGDHPCEAEVSSACPESPPREISSCLKDPSRHDSETELSSDCTDFIALNTACAKEIDQFCDGGFFTGDTVLCLKTWTDPESLSEKCRNVMKWAAPQGDDDGDGGEAESSDDDDEQDSMSEEDKLEKQAWREKRKAAREAAIDRMKMKERDAAKERERVELERFKREQPEEYAAMVAQQEEETRQQAEQKKRERLLAAAAERKRRAAAEGESDSSAKPSTKKSSSGKKKKNQAASWTMPLLKGVVGLIGAGVWFYSGMGKGGKSGGKKKKRG